MTALTLEKQVCSLDLAKRLKELGVKQESHFYWNLGEMSGKHYVIDADYYQCPCESEEGYHSGCDLRAIAAETKGGPGQFDPDQACSAFTVAELGEMLPLWSQTHQDEKGIWAGNIYINEERHHAYNYDKKSATEADERAKMLIYLLENKLMTV